MIAAFRRWRLLSDLRRTPHHELVAQHEILIRLARRCAYDFRHAVDGIPQGHWFRTELQLDQRPHHWLAIFNQGNPGKDYRLKLHAQLDHQARHIEELEAFIVAAGLEPSADLEGLPF